ncbi:sigma-E factor negative regulatory protein [Kaarinaea lacus]
MTIEQENGEKLSTLFDDELNPQHSEQFISNLCKDDDMKACLGRYQMISDSMRNQLPAGIRKDFSHNVMTAIASEPTVLAPVANSSKIPNLSSIVTKKVAGFAIAASVATIAVIGVQSQNNDEPQQMATTMPDKSEFVRLAKEKPATSSVVQPVLAQKPSSGYSTASTMVRQPQVLQSNTLNSSTNIFNPQLQQYIVIHSQSTSGAGVHDIFSSARIASSSHQISSDQVQR